MNEGEKILGGVLRHLATNQAGLIPNFSLPGFNTGFYFINHLIKVRACAV
jgi:hypothetical protein